MSVGKAVVITGVGFVCSIGNAPGEVAASLRDLKSGIGPMTWFPGCESPVRVAGLIRDFDVNAPMWAQWRYPEAYTLRKEALRSLPPHGVYALCATLQALAEARLPEADLSAEDTGLFCASAGSPYLQGRFLRNFYETKGTRGHPMGILSSVSGTLNFNLGAYFRIKGANLGFSSACASASHALGYACEEIRTGRQRRMVVVGAEDLTAETILPFAAMRALSVREGSDASRPFDISRDGFVGTGGAVALILESAEAATARKAPVRARLLGWGQASDGFAAATSVESGDGLARAMGNALRDAGVRPDEIDYVNAHATATVIGDRSEARALERVFGSAQPPVSSTKALTGHALSMAGALEAGIATVCLEKGLLPGQAHLCEVDPACAHLNIPRSSREASVRTVLSNSSGFGGSNVCLVLGKGD